MISSKRLTLLNITSTSSWLLVGAMACFISNRSHAADASADSPPQTVAVQMTVEQSTPVDKLLQKIYPNSPIAVSVLRQALVEANPKVITGNPQQRVKAGAVLMVPDHAQVASKVLAPLVAEHTAKSFESGPSARDNAVRKPWVRFP
jgi:Tfp pilus assembly protein FimV